MNYENVKGFTNIKEFGAVGDGITDDTTALMEAVQCGEPVYFPEGVYILKKQLETGKIVRWFGAGEETVIRLIPEAGFSQKEVKTDKGEMLTVFTCRMLNMKEGELLEIRNMTIDGNKKAFDADESKCGFSMKDHIVCVEVHNTDQIILDSVAVKNSLIEGVYAYHVKKIQVMHSVFEGNGFRQEDASGLHIDSCNFEASDCIITDCRFVKNGFNGLLLTNVRGAVASKIESTENGFDGVAFWGGSSNCVLLDVISQRNRGGINFRRNYSPRLDRSTEKYCENNIIVGLVTQENDYGIVWGGAKNITVNGWKGQDRFNHTLFYVLTDEDEPITGTISNASLSPTIGEISEEYNDTSKFKVKNIMFF